MVNKKARVKMETHKGLRSIFGNIYSLNFFIIYMMLHLLLNFGY